jgi:proline iminopeptidase
MNRHRRTNDARSRTARSAIARAAVPAAAAAAAAAAYHWLARPHFSSLGATLEEQRAAYPGDDLIPDGRRGGTMATTIAAPPGDVWPWLVQMGCDRAGFYSWDRLDNGGKPSAERIHPEWQDLAEGDRMASVPDGSTWFDVALLEPERTLVLRTSLRLPKPECFDPAAETPRAFVDSTWGFHLRPTPEGHTRLVVTGRGRGRPRWLFDAGNWLFWDPSHWLMQTRQFAGLRRRVEGTAR